MHPTFFLCTHSLPMVLILSQRLHGAVVSATNYEFADSDSNRSPGDSASNSLQCLSSLSGLLVNVG